MPKYYINCGTLKLIYSTDKNVEDAAVSALWETNKNDVLDEHFYIDERGYRDYTNADKETSVIQTKKVCGKAGWEINKEDNS
jgi:hypothetical protein